MDKILNLVNGFILVLLLIIPWVRYWIYYKPFYMIFKNSLYLPFYLHIGERTILFVAFVIFLLLPLWEEQDTYIILITIVSGIICLYFLGKNIFHDVVFITKEKYLTAACNINTLRCVQHAQSFSFAIYGNKKTDGKRIDIELNFYQYNELKKERKRNNNKVILVYYLPNTKRMLNHESYKRI